MKIGSYSSYKNVTTGATLTQTNSCNGLGPRVKKVEGSNAFTLTDDAIDSDVLSDGAASYMQGAGGLIGETRGGTSKYYHADALGTTRAITNSTQTKTDSLDTDAFGMNGVEAVGQIVFGWRQVCLFQGMRRLVVA